MTPTAQGGPVLPEAVRRYHDAHDHDVIETALSAFTADASVTDENRTYRGSDQIRRWLAAAATQFTYTRTVVRAEQTSPSTWVVVNTSRATSREAASTSATGTPSTAA